MGRLPTASVSISFVVSTLDVSAILIAEINAEDNNGKVRFEFGGAAPRFRVYRSPNVSKLHIFTSDGNSVLRNSNISENLTEFLVFTGAVSGGGEQEQNDNAYRQASVSKPVTGEYSINNIYGNIGAVSLVESGLSTFQCSKESANPLDPVVGFCQVKYDTRYSLYELTGISLPSGFGQDGFDQYRVIVYIIGETTT